MLINETHKTAAEVQSPNDVIRVEVLQHLESVNSIAEEWESLLKSSTCNRAFSSFTWYQKTCIIDQSLQPYVILAYRNEKLVGILSLAHYIEGDVLRFPSDHCDYSDMIIQKNDWEVAEVILSYLFDLENQYKNILLKCLRKDSNIYIGISKLKQQKNYASCFSQITRFNCPYTELPSTIDDYLKSKSKSFRYEIKRKEQKANQLGYEVKLLKPKSFSANEIPEIFLQLHEARLGKKSGLVTIEKVREFIYSAFPILFEQGYLLPFVLMHDNKIKGMQLYMLSHNGLAYWNGGFESEVSRLSPGVLTFIAAIRHAINIGLNDFDLLRGEEAYKLKWTNNTRMLSQFNSKNKTAL